MTLKTKTHTHVSFMVPGTLTENQINDLRSNIQQALLSKLDMQLSDVKLDVETHYWETK